MVDFLLIATRQGKKGITEIYPKFIIKKSKDLMIRGGDFYAIWIEPERLWSTDENRALQLIDHELDSYVEAHKDILESYSVLHMWDAESGMIDNWHKYCQRQMRDSFHMLDETLIFSNTDTTKEMFASHKLDYALSDGPITNYDELMTTLYLPEERQKIEWAIGAIVTGDAKRIQKFMVLYGPPGSGKSTVLNIIEKLFAGYCSVFDAKALGSSSNAFALEAFKSNPLVAIQQDGDLSRIEDNTRLNSLVSHESMMVNEKFKSAYSNQFKCFIFLGTNKPVRITDAKSGLIRRLIDVEPSGEKIPAKRYRQLVKAVDFELGAIAWHCKAVYEADRHLYDDYVPLRMLGASNDFYNFMLDSYYIFKKEDSTTLAIAWTMYKAYCEEAKVNYPYSKRIVKEELLSYFREYKERGEDSEGNRVRSFYSGFRLDKFEEQKPIDISAVEEPKSWIDLKVQHSLLDDICADCPAQYATADEIPQRKWVDVKTKLRDIDTSKLHYVKVPENLIVIDFDLPGPDGTKSLERNLEAASKWPATYAELSKSGKAIHLHYIYSGDVTKLSRIYEEHIEVKVFTGKSSLRRMVTKCNDIPIAAVNSGLPLKGDKAVANLDGIKSEKLLRTMIWRNLNKEIHPFTTPSINFIQKLLDDAYASELKYDVSDMRNSILAFAASSTHQAAQNIKTVSKMHFKSEEVDAPITSDERPIVIFDCEVFPNLFLVNWKLFGDEYPVRREINPSAAMINSLAATYRLVGFNNRRYDNHMLYGRMCGYSCEGLYDLSQRIISGDRTAMFGDAYDLSYTDVYDFCSKKQSLKKWEIELGIHHQELGLPWDKPVPEEMWNKVAEYCDNDVLATEELFKARQGDFVAREILADLAGMTVNDTTNTLTTRIIFGREKHPALVYTDLATGKSDDIVDVDDILTDTNICNAFPGYEWKRLEDGKYHNMYRGTDLGMGGYVYAEPGMYTNVALLDVASLHPHSAVALRYFGKYTKHFTDLMNARIYIKHGDYDSAKELFDGKLSKYLDDPKQAKALAQALKIAINSVYGLTSAKFDNPFKNPKNVNNIVALRGALFMRTLQDEVQARGFTVAHIKTDSIKIPNATPEIIDFCMKFANRYGYEFEHEATYEKMCLVNDAVYIAKYKDGEHADEWTATGTQFQVPYVFKTLFSKKPLIFDDFCETKSVSKGAIYLDLNAGLPEGEHDYKFVGRVGQFTPIDSTCPSAGDLVRNTGEDNRYSAVTGTKGYRWMESEMAKSLEFRHRIDDSYYKRLVNEAVDTISQYGDFEWFVSDDSIDIPPWEAAEEPWNDAGRNFDVR